MSIVRVDGMGQHGDGVLRGPNGVVHVAKVLPGESIELVGGKLTRVVTPSAERIEPFCDHYAACGGCKFQHWDAAAYSHWKRELLVSILARAGLDTEIFPIVDAHGPGRRRVVLHVREREGVWHAGFMEEKSHKLTEIDRCPVLERPLRDCARIASDFGPTLGPCDVAITLADNGLDVAIKAERSAARHRMSVLQDIYLRHNLCRLSLNGEAFYTRLVPFVSMGAAQVTLPVQSFLQATKLGEETLASVVGRALRKSKNIADLFCGMGPFALRLATLAKVEAFDFDKGAIGSLQLAAKNTQSLKPIRTEVRDLIRNPLVALELKEFDGVVLDPPRAGAEAQARLLAKSKVKRVVSVSCDVQSFARDARILVSGGYSFKSVLPVDQFKWTPHLEMVGVFER